MKQRIWLLTWDDGSIQAAFINLTDARDFVLKEVRETLRGEEDEEDEYQAFIKELNENYNEYKGFWIDGWFYCNAIELYK